MEQVCCLSTCCWYSLCLNQNLQHLLGIKPEEFDPFHEFVVCDELSRCGSGGVLWGLIGGLGIGLPPIIAFGSEQIKARIIPAVLSGEKFICLAVTEPGRYYQ